MGIQFAALGGLACALGVLSPAQGATEIVIGDSLAERSGLENFAHISDPIRATMVAASFALTATPTPMRANPGWMSPRRTSSGWKRLRAAHRKIDK